MTDQEPDTSAEDAAELDRFSDAFMDYLFAHGHLSKTFEPWWQSRKKQIAERSPRHALRAVRLICKDHLEMTRHWTEADVASLDRHLESSGALTLTMLRRRLWRPPSPPTIEPSRRPRLH